MADNNREVVYRVYRPGVAGPVVGLPLLAIVAGLAYGAANGVSLVVVAGPAAVLIVLLAWGYARGRLSATITGPDRLTLRRPFGSRTLQWPDIQAIELETQPVWTAQARQLRNAAVAYDRQGRRIALPGVDDTHVASLDDEVRALRALWQRRRGEGWEAAPGATAAMDQARRGAHRRSAWLMGSVVAMGLLFCALVIVVVVLTGGPVAALVLMGILPVAAGGAAFVVALHRQKKAGQTPYPGGGDGSPTEP
ncbi:MAG TPA: PH domain-containing protein [Mycobacteriales bacterium]|nr:PH domain-containing protein [Mycobacteriales bacterium]